MGSIRISILCFLLPAFLTGCSLFQAANSPVIAEFTEDFEVSGRIAVKINGEGSSARIKWSHRGDVDAVDVYTPVGSIIAVILVSPRTGAMLETKDETHTATSVEELTHRVLGWSLPLSGLKFWARGRVDPSVFVGRVAPLDDQNRMTYFEQDGWKITFLRYSEESDVPRVIKLEHGDLKIRFIVDEWKVLGQ